MSRQRQPLPLGDGPEIEAAKMLGLDQETFQLFLPTLYARGFPLPDQTTRKFDLDAIMVWKRRAPVGHILSQLSEMPRAYQRPVPTPQVYFIGCGSFVKIGCSMGVADRMKELQSGNPATLYLLATEPGHMTREAELHRRFAALRHLNEWFRYEGELRAYVEGLPK